jgi:hypothetical protein
MTQPQQFPNMNAHGVGFKSPREPRSTAVLTSRRGAKNITLPIIIPRQGQTYSRIITLAGSITSILLLNEMKQQQCMMLSVLAISIVACWFALHAWRRVVFFDESSFWLGRKYTYIRFDSQEFLRKVTLALSFVEKPQPR